MNEDVLEKHASWIRWAEEVTVSQLTNRGHPKGEARCIADLAAALRTLRTERDEDDARYMKALKRIANADAEIERLRERGEESGMIFRQLQRSAQAKDETIRELRARVAELEAHLAATDPWKEASKR